MRMSGSTATSTVGWCTLEIRFALRVNSGRSEAPRRLPCFPCFSALSLLSKHWISNIHWIFKNMLSVWMFWMPDDMRRWSYIGYVATSLCSLHKGDVRVWTDIVYDIVWLGCVFFKGPVIWGFFNSVRFIVSEAFGRFPPWHSWSHRCREDLLSLKQNDKRVTRCYKYV